MKASTRDRAVGTAKVAKGRVKQAVGRADRRPRKETEGLVDEAGGRFQKKTGEIKKVFGR